MAETQTNTNCRLCGTLGPLCRSHIVPELAYEPLKNDRGQLYRVGGRAKTIQVGHREPLLCANCENALSGYESHFNRVWMSSIPSDFSHLKTGPDDHLEVQVDNYSMFKLFHLSVFWRAAVSLNFKLEDRISLGSHERDIAKMLLTGDPGQPGSFPFIASLNLDDRKHPVGAVAPLAQGTGTIEGCPYYLMTYAYCDWIFLLANPGPEFLVRWESIYRARNIFVLLTSPFEESKGVSLWVDIFRQMSTDWRH